MGKFKFLISSLTALVMWSGGQFAHAASLSNEQADQYRLNLASPNQMREAQLGNKVIQGSVRLMLATYDFSVLGGAIGTLTLHDIKNQPAVLPKGAVITSCIIDVKTAATTSASGTIALSTGQTGADLKAATAAASYTGLVACIPVGSAATAIKLTADSTMTAVIATGAITAGKLTVAVQYIVDP